MATDWKKIAQARGLAIPERELERSAAVLDQMEIIFRPLVCSLPPEWDPALLFRAAEEVE
jgi:hypothetical protein